jgi:hypothetical protein
LSRCVVQSIALPARHTVGHAREPDVGGVDLVKIDVEGAEEQALDDQRDWPPPRQLVIEVHEWYRIAATKAFGTHTAALTGNRLIQGDSDINPVHRCQPLSPPLVSNSDVPEAEGTQHHLA